jgi:hypothetical protein
MNRNKFKAGTAFQDMLFLMLSGVTVLWVLSFLLINPVAKINDIESPAEFIITMEWADHSDDDLDLWLRTPSGAVIGFFNKDQDGANLERDDLGLVTDCFMLTETAANEQQCIKLNRETITLRGLIPGEYQLKFVVYNIGGGTSIEGNPVNVEIIKVNPYSIEFKREYQYQKHKQSVSIIRFTVDAEGNITEFSEVPAVFDRDRTPTPRITENGAHL